MQLVLQVNLGSWKSQSRPRRIRVRRQRQQTVPLSKIQSITRLRMRPLGELESRGFRMAREKAGV
jgi:hypothetical protein